MRALLARWMSRLRSPMSKSMTQVLCPFIASPIPMLAAVVVLPTPPFPEVMHTTRESVPTPRAPANPDADAPPAAALRIRRSSGLDCCECEYDGTPARAAASPPRRPAALDDDDARSRARAILLLVMDERAPAAVCAKWARWSGKTQME